MATLKFPLTYNAEWEKWKLRFIALIADTLTPEMFVEWSSTKHIILNQTFLFVGLPWQPEMLNLQKNI